MKLVVIRNVETHALELVVLVLSALLLTTILFVVVQLDTPEILSLDANQFVSLIDQLN